MSKNHMLLADKISENPHHYFKVEHNTPAALNPVVVPLNATTHKSYGNKKTLEKKKFADVRQSYNSEKNILQKEPEFKHERIDTLEKVDAVIQTQSLS